MIFFFLNFWCGVRRSSPQVEEINAIVSKAFKVAYASIRSKRQFVRLVNELNKEQEEYQTQVQKYIEAKEDQRVNPEELSEKLPLISPDRVRGVGVGQSRVWVRKSVHLRTLTTYSLQTKLASRTLSLQGDDVRKTCVLRSVSRSGF